MKLVSIHIQLIFLLILILAFHSSSAQVWSLKQCIDTARSHNKNLQMARNHMAIGKQKHEEIKAGLMPKVAANADYRYYTNLPYQLMPSSVFGGPDGQFKEAQFGVPHNLNANLQLSMPLFNPALYGTIKTTEIASELTDLQYLKTEEQVFFEISNLYYNAQILNHQLALIDSNLENAKKLLQNVQLLRDQLLAKGTDVSNVKLQIAQISTQRAGISSKYKQVLNALKFSTGIPIADSLEIDPNIQFQKPEEYTGTSILDIQLIQTQSRLLTSELSTLKSSRRPSLSLFGTFGTMGLGYDKRPNEFLKFYPVGFAGLQLSYPLFNGTVTKRKINQKQLELQNGDLQLKLTIEQNNMQAGNSKLQRGVAEQAVGTAKEQINLAKTIYNQTILQQKLGTATLTEVLMADNALREAQQTYLSAIVDYLKADLELRKFTGNLTIGNRF